MAEFDPGYRLRPGLVVICVACCAKLSMYGKVPDEDDDEDEECDPFKGALICHYCHEAITPVMD